MLKFHNNVTFATIGLNDTVKMSPTSVNALIFRRGCGSLQWRTKVTNLFVAAGVVQAVVAEGRRGGYIRILYRYQCSIGPVELPS